MEDAQTKALHELLDRINSLIEYYTEVVTGYAAADVIEAATAHTGGILTPKDDKIVALMAESTRKAFSKCLVDLVELKIRTEVVPSLECRLESRLSSLEKKVWAITERE